MLTYFREDTTAGFEASQSQPMFHRRRNHEPARLHVSGQEPPPTANTPRKVVKSAHFRDVRDGQRCILCLRKKIRQNRSGSKQSIWHNVHTGDDFGKHLLAWSLNRHVDAWLEDSSSHRYTDLEHQMIACNACYLKGDRRFSSLPFNPETSDYYAYFVDVRPDPESQPTGSQLEPASMEEAPQESFTSVDGNVVLGPDDFDDAMTFTGIPWSENLPDVEAVIRDNSDDVEPDASQSQEALIPLYWRKEDGAPSHEYRLVKVPSDTSKCIVCDTVTTTTDALFLTKITQWTFVEFDLVAFQTTHNDTTDENRYTPDDHFICGNCNDDNGLTTQAHELLARKGTLKRAPPRIKLRINQPQNEVDDLNARAGAQRTRGKQVANALSLEKLTDEACADATSLRKVHVKVILLDSTFGEMANGLKAGTTLTAMNKLMLYLIYIRHHLSYRAQASIFNLSRSTVARVLNEVEQSLVAFTSAHTAFPVPNEIRNELTTVFASALFYTDAQTEPLILIADGSYMYMNVPTSSAEANHAHFSGQKKRYLRKTMSVVTTTGHIVYSNALFKGKRTDSQMMKDIVESPEEYGATDLVNCLEQNEVILILDRGLLRSLK